MEVLIDVFDQQGMSSIHRMNERMNAMIYSLATDHVRGLSCKWVDMDNGITITIAQSADDTSMTGTIVETITVLGTEHGQRGKGTRSANQPLGHHHRSAHANKCCPMQITNDEI